MDSTDVLFGTESTGEELSAIASASTSGLANAGPVTVQSQLFQPISKQQKRKRNRAILSCQPCHERKQQCDRAKPCSRCLGRGSKDECIYFEHPAHKIQKTGNNGNVNSPDPPLLFRQGENVNNIQNALGDIEPTALMGLEALLHLVQASNAVPGPAAHLTLGDSASDRNNHAVHVAAAALSQLSQQATPGTSPSNGSMAEFLQQIRAGSTHTPLSDLPGLADLRSHFPNHVITGHLLYHFFEHSSVPWLWSMIHKPVFDSCYVTFSSGHQPPSFDFIALLAMVCASSLQFLPETTADQAVFAEYAPGRDVLKKRLYEFSRSILVFNHSLSPSLEHVQALILLALYQLNEGSLIGYYNSSAASIRMAQLLWMNRGVLPTWNLDPLEVEIRRKVWWTLFILDRQQCLILRRPYMIYEQHCDVILPQNIDEAQLQQDPAEQVFLLLQIRWSKLIGKMWDKCFTTHPPTYRDLFYIEEDIKRFELDLPSSFHLPTLQVPTRHPCVIFQNRILTLQIYHSRVLILRPFLLVHQVNQDSNPVDEKYVNFQDHARYVCLMICKRLLAWQLIIQNQADRVQLRWADCVSRVFDTALTMAVAIISNPTHTRNGELDEWVSLAQNLLLDMIDSNALAHKASQCLDLVQRHAHTVSQSTFELPGGLSPSIPIPQYLERATETMAQPQPSMIDLFDAQDIAEPMWGSEIAPAYLARFPSMELCCENVGHAPLQKFINEWSLLHS